MASIRYTVAAAPAAAAVYPFPAHRMRLLGVIDDFCIKTFACVVNKLVFVVDCPVSSQKMGLAMRQLPTWLVVLTGKIYMHVQKLTKDNMWMNLEHWKTGICQAVL